MQGEVWLKQKKWEGAAKVEMGLHFIVKLKIITIK